MSEDRLPSPCAKYSFSSKKSQSDEDSEKPAENRPTFGTVTQSYMNDEYDINDIVDFDNDEEFPRGDNDTGENVQDFHQSENTNGLGEPETSIEHESAAENLNDEEGGGGRNGGRSTMGDVMELNNPNNGNENNHYNNIDYDNENNFGNDDPNDNNFFYEDNLNFGDDGPQIVANGNDTNFFV